MLGKVMVSFKNCHCQGKGQIGDEMNTVISVMWFRIGINAGSVEVVMCSLIQ